MFRTYAQTRAQSSGPPSAFPGSLTPGIGSSDSSSSSTDGRALRHRLSRTDLDFEQALRGEGTVRISEGLDVNALGKDASLSLSPSGHRAFLSPAASPAAAPAAPATPTIVPPTPQQQASSSRMPSAAATAAAGRAVSPTSPLNRNDDPFTDATPDRVNRRSMYRSPGTSSSPDLATLLKKARERGTDLKPGNYKEKRKEEPPPLPSAVGVGHPPRQRASTGVGGSSSPNKLQRPLPPSPNPSTEWVMPSPNVPRENGTIKVRGTVRPICAFYTHRQP